jgi:hypothetical protein
MAGFWSIRKLGTFGYQFDRVIGVASESGAA